MNIHDPHKYCPKHEAAMKENHPDLAFPIRENECCHCHPIEGDREDACSEKVGP